MHGFVVEINKSRPLYSLDCERYEDYFAENFNRAKIQRLKKENLKVFCNSTEICIRESEDHILLKFGRVYLDRLIPEGSKLDIDMLISFFRNESLDELIKFIDGDFFIYIYDKRNDSHHFITDKGGFVPVYIFQKLDLFVISSHPDAIAVSVGIDTVGPLDIISIAEFLNTSRIEFPNTYYQNIQQLLPGNLFEIRTTKLKATTYWAPEADFSYNKQELTDKLAATIQKVVIEATNPEFGTHGIFLSGGADSRAILFSRHKDASLSAATFFDQPNDEFFTAQKLAQRAKVPHKGLKRSFEHYGNSAIEYVKTTQGMMALTDNHYFSFLDEIRTLNIDNWHTGCFADWFFKGIAFNTSYKQLLGKPLPTWQIFSPFTYTFHTYECPINPEFDHQVKTRLKIRYKDVIANPNLDDKSLWEIEKLRLWPINREFTFGSRMTLSSSLNWHPIISRGSMLDIWRKIPPSYKLNGLIWKKAVAKICNGNNDIKDNNWGSYIGFSPQINSLFFVLKIIQRKFRKNKSLPTGSWPDFRYYVSKSEVLKELWAQNQGYSAPILTQILGYNPFVLSSFEWSKKDVVLFTRLISVHLWLNLINHNFSK